MSYQTLIPTIIIIICSFASLNRHFQILQQNSYFITRYLKWLVKAFSLRAVSSAVLLAFSAVCIRMEYNKLLNIIAVISLLRIAIAYHEHKKSIKKLVFTTRVIRMFSTSAAIEIALFLVSLFTDGMLQLILLTIAVCLAFMPSVLCLLGLVIMLPFDKLLCMWFTFDAKRKLKSVKNLTVIAITGSYGKTSTKYILNRILSEKYNVLMTPESFNTPMGIVKTIREKLTPQTEIFIAEMGAKKSGDIKEICKITNPKYGIITSIGPQHLETFKTLENIIDTKFELVDFCQENAGICFLNGDNQHIFEKSENYSPVLYGTNPEFDCFAQNISYDRNGIVFEIKSGDQCVSLHSRLLGAHNALNITAAVTVALHLGVSDRDISYAVSQLIPVDHRLQMKPYINGCILIDDAYNANPAGCLEAVNVLSSFEGMKKIIVTPGLVELGNQEYECNYTLGQKAGEICDIIILVGKKRAIPIANGVKTTDFDTQNLYVADSFATAVKIFSPMCDKNTVILFENDLPDNYLT